MNNVLRLQKRGISLLEIVITIAIISGTFAFVAQPLMSFYRELLFQGATEHTMSMLDEARKSTLSSYYSDRYGVHFETSKVVLFKGSTYSASDPNNDEYEFGNGISITSITLTGGGSEVVFDRITGETSQDGAVDIDSSFDNFSARTITIHPSGLVEIQ